jgi:hypothetical protein
MDNSILSQIDGTPLCSGVIGGAGNLVGVFNGSAAPLFDGSCGGLTSFALILTGFQPPGSAGPVALTEVPPAPVVGHSFGKARRLPFYVPPAACNATDRGRLGCPDPRNPALPLAVDQVGRARPQGLACDVGSIER